MTTADHILAAIVLCVSVIYPIVDARRFQSRLARIGARPSGERLRVYVELIAWLWLSAGIVVAGWHFLGYEFQQLGFRFQATPAFWFVVAVVLAVIVFFAFTNMGIQNSEKLQQTVRDSLSGRDEASLIPATKKELGYWGLCSVSASAEEVVFRGFAVWYFTTLLGLPIAAIAATVLFALVHLYQGVGGVLRSGLYGAVLLATVLVSGSIWPAILLHIAQDFHSGLAGYLSSQGSLGEAA